MPTTRPRLVVTETDPVKAALDRAAARWPNERSRARLLVRIAEEWANDDEQEQERAQAEVIRRRRAAIAATAGTMSDVYPPGYLEELRRDWPE